ncbi:MAG: Hr1 domain-containing protein [Oscillospiraceae bacterium]|jgi:septal ring factor EnvC (AmiA/AmiB activator)
MEVEGISASVSVVSGDISSGSTQNRISELVRLEQDVQKLKEKYKNKANTDGMSQIEINAKIRKYEKLIAKIEEEIRQLKKQQSSKQVEFHKGQKNKNDVSKRRDNSMLSVAALKASYRMLPAAASLSVQDIPQNDKSDLDSSVDKHTINELI